MLGLPVDGRCWGGSLTTIPFLLMKAGSYKSQTEQARGGTTPGLTRWVASEARQHKGVSLLFEKKRRKTQLKTQLFNCGVKLYGTRKIT